MASTWGPDRPDIDPPTSTIDDCITAVLVVLLVVGAFYVLTLATT